MKVVTPRPPRFDWVEALIKEARRRARRRRRWYGAAAFVAASAALLGYFGFDRGGGVTRPANKPTPASAPGGIFAKVHGWIAYGDYRGIWAVDPTRPSDPEDQVLLSDYPGRPLAWSSDGSKLLILREDLFVLHADGTENRLIHHGGWMVGGSFSPDGSQVVYNDRGRIYIVDVDGGTPRLVLSPSRRRLPGGYRFRTELYAPAFSPDGTHIAYFDGMGDWGNSLRVMKADGSGVRVVADDLGLFFGKNSEVGSVSNLIWSPDASRLAFSIFPPGEGGGIWTVGVDGSGLTRVIPHGENPAWSPDGSRISYQPVAPCVQSSRDPRGCSIPPDLVTLEPTLEIATLDGTRVTQVQEFGYAGSGPWNPLPLSVPGNPGATAIRAQGLAAPFVYAIVALGVVGALVLARRARRRTAAG